MNEREEIPFTRLAVLGLGQMGCSVGMGARMAGIEVWGFDPSRETAEGAARLGAADHLVSSAAEAAESAEAVLLASPVSAILETLTREGPVLAERDLVTDVGSVKEPVVSRMEQVLGAGGPGVGGHPMAGNEVSGPAGARADMFRGRPWVLCPGAASREEAVGRALWLVRRLGAKPLLAEPGEHDRQVAFSSHLPYLSAVALALSALSGGAGSLVGPSLWDGTRVAASDPSMAGDYCFHNRKHLRGAVASLICRLEALQESLEGYSDESLYRLLEGARAARSQLFPGTERDQKGDCS